MLSSQMQYDQSLKTQFLESDKFEIESWLHCLLKFVNLGYHI